MEKAGFDISGGHAGIRYEETEKNVHWKSESFRIFQTGFNSSFLVKQNTYTQERKKNTTCSVAMSQP